MFRILCDTSSGSMELYLNEIICSGSQLFVVCLVSVWQRNFQPVLFFNFVYFKLLYNVDFNL